MRLSLTTKLLGGIVATIVVLAAIATFFAIRGFSAQHEALFAADFEKAVENRAEQESNLFRDIRNAHLAADVNLERKAAALDPEEAAALFDRYFPLQADGTRRSLDILFEGGRVETIGEVYGVGAFFADGAALTTEDKVAIWAAFEVVAESGQALFGQFSNFIFATPNNGLMIFGPTRSDRLVYYRKEAPADFSFSHLEMSQMMLPENNPQGATRCTELTTLLSDSNGVELMTGCYTPVRVDGRHLGSWGVTVTVSGLFRRAVASPPVAALHWRGSRRLPRAISSWPSRCTPASSTVAAASLSWSSWCATASITSMVPALSPMCLRLAPFPSRMRTFRRPWPRPQSMVCPSR